MTETDLAWLSGLIEGEGSFYLKSKRGKLVPAISISMTDSDVIERARVLMGIRTTSTRTRGERKPIYEIRVTGKRAVDLILALRPHMGIRRTAKIDEILAALDSGEADAPGTGTWRRKRTAV